MTCCGIVEPVAYAKYLLSICTMCSGQLYLACNVPEVGAYTTWLSTRLLQGTRWRRHVACAQSAGLPKAGQKRFRRPMLWAGMLEEGTRQMPNHFGLGFELLWNLSRNDAIGTLVHDMLHARELRCRTMLDALW